MSFFSDLGNVAKEFNDIKNDVTSAFSGLTDEVDVIRQETISTAAEIKEKASSAVTGAPIDDTKTTTETTGKPE